MGMGGVQRTAKFTKYLRSHGWQPHVLTVTPKLYLASDNCLLNEVEEAGVKIYRTGSKEVNGNGHRVVQFKNDSNRKFLSNLSQTFFIPDSKIFWKSRAVDLGSRIIEENDIDLIYATAPPYTDFLTASKLKEKFNIPVVLDYRDSWIDCPNNFYATPFHKSFHKKMETEVLKTADRIVTINSRIKELILLRYPFKTDEDIVIIPQGFDPQDFNKSHDDDYKTDKMRITYSGSFLNYYTPKHFLDGLKQALSKKSELKDKVEACFIGTFPEEYKDYIKQIGIESMVNTVGYLEHSVCVKYLMESDVLWMMINKTERSDLHSTGKLYEYFGARKPILACVPEGVARKSLENHGAVKLTLPDDSQSIAEAILEYYELFEKDLMPKPNEELINHYDRRNLTKELAAVFDKAAKKLSETIIS